MLLIRAEKGHHDSAFKNYATQRAIWRGQKRAQGC